MASQIMLLLFSSLVSHKNAVNVFCGLKDFLKNSKKRDNISYGIFNYILQMLSLYYPDPKKAVSSLPDGSVLSFDGMSDAEQDLFEITAIHVHYRSGIHNFEIWGFL